VVPQLGDLSTKLEETLSKAHQQAAYNAVKEQHVKYFEALEKHPRLLVGVEVPAIDRDGTETLRDSDDAKEWQEAVRSILITEIKAQAETKLEESAGFLETIHASIDLFKNNNDLIPGTKDFDVALANEFAAMAQPYEVRVEGKLQGYSIPVQPIINNLRTQLQARRSSPAAVAPAAVSQPVGVLNAPEPPQAGLVSKAGNSSEKEDFSTLFGTIGLPNLQI
jgi:hypothetical protein